MPENYIDIHNHLLAGIDDGAKTREDTISLISGMQDLNITGAIPTPHTFHGLWNNTTSTIKKAYDTAIETDPNRTFLNGYASEYLLDATLIDQIKREPLLCIKDNYVLVELPFFNNPLNLYEMLFELKMKNYKIILAHPERYRYFHKDTKKFNKLKESGVYFQLNLLSLTGYYGKEIQKIAEQLLENELYDFTGTDIHNERHIEELKTNPIPFPNKNKIGDLLEKNSVFNTF
jgi:tyrosine-protein phosphatase YwqE